MTIIILQLNPAIPVYHAQRGEGYAILAIDYSQEHNLIFTVVFDTGEIWSLPTNELRGCWNESMGRIKRVEPF